MLDSEGGAASSWRRVRRRWWRAADSSSRRVKHNTMLPPDCAVGHGSIAGNCGSITQVNGYVTTAGVGMTRQTDRRDVMNVMIM